MTTTPNGSYAQAWFFDEYNETARAMLQHWMNSNEMLHNVAASKQCQTKIDAVSFLMFRPALLHLEL